MANEKRLIDANALKEKLQGHHDFFVDGVGGFRFLTPKDKSRVDEIINCIAEIVNAPTVDAVEVAHARWERVIPTKSAAKWSTKVSCSVCHKQGYTHHNYCPHCGAKMDGGNEDG